MFNFCFFFFFNDTATTEIYTLSLHDALPISMSQTFAAVDDVVHFNQPAPRLGATYDIGGDGKTVVKFNAGRYYWNPGADFLLTNVNPNSAVWWKRYAWTTDLNGNGLYDRGE